MLLKKLIVTQLVRRFNVFYGTRKFITVFTRAHCCPYHERNESSSHPYVSSRSFLILSTHLHRGLRNGLFNYVSQMVFPTGSRNQPFPSAFPTMHLSFVISPMRVTWPIRLILYDLITLIIFGEENSLWRSSYNIFCKSWYFFGPNIPSARCSQTSSVFDILLASETKFHAHTTQQAKL
jgi:hypothetical protein